RDAEVDLAPHVKTTMSPQVFAAQEAAGAWAATVANVAQARWLRTWGCRRIVIANQVVDPIALDWVVEQADGGACEVCFWVDSLAGVEASEAARARAGAGPALRVLVEVGHRGGRTGCRTLEEAVAIAAAVTRSDALELHGVACFEGLVAPGDADDVVSALLRRTVEVADQVRDLSPVERFVLTAGGSAYFDRVVAAFASQSRETTRVVLRSGCYVMHDVGFYDEVAPALGHGRAPLRSALEVWGAVHSTPEPGLALVGIGKRDVGYDMGYPRALTRRRGDDMRAVRGRVEVTALNDQHAHVADPDGLLAVGDLVGFGVSHPCTTLDKWSTLALVDDDYTLIDWIDTAFTRHRPGQPG
ncbi:MAG TPA: alanine racemase, partial [Solirubrobacteraceae bacterium]|nr:alanine racemase [Solirubrobacteraceae bacterium]